VRLLEGGGAAIYTIPWLGGQEQKLVDLSGPIRYEEGHWIPRFAWSPEGAWLALAEQSRDDEPSRIVRLSLQTLEKKAITSPPRDSGGDLLPALSPDGTELAFVRAGSRTYGDLDLWVQSVERGEPRQVTFKKYDDISQVAWTADGGEVVFDAGSMASSRVFRVPRSGGEPQPVPGVGQNAAHPSLRGSRMVHEQWVIYGMAVWRVQGRAASAPTQAPVKLIASSASDNNPTYSPDGRRIAFSSDRSGAENIWVCDSDGANPVQLTSFESHTGTPRWSPDGRHLVFDSLEAGDWNVYVIDAEGGKPRRLTPEPSSDENRGTWSRDGRFVYFDSDRSARARRARKEIWRIPSEGGPAVRVTRDGGIHALESADGKSLYYSKEERPSGIWRVPVTGGEETELVPGPVYWSDWAPAPSGIYFMPFVSAEASSRENVIRHLAFATGRMTDLYRDKGRYRSGLSVTADERSILYGDAPPWTSELIVIENLR
jgi:Tol biopolymer transport system component